jgi:hypothetical protein
MYASALARALTDPPALVRFPLAAVLDWPMPLDFLSVSVFPRARGADGRLMFSGNVTRIADARHTVRPAGVDLRQRCVPACVVFCRTLTSVYSSHAIYLSQEDIR